MKHWIDPITGLEWYCLAEEANWNFAMNAVSGKGDGWRIPTIQELETLLDRSKYSPTMREDIPFRDNSDYWSSTSYAGNTEYAWTIRFNSGSVHYENKANNHFVRCVREPIVKSDVEPELSCSCIQCHTESLIKHPYVCPLCEGYGIWKNTGIGVAYKKCPVCDGKRIIWG